jgi:arginase
VQTPETTASGYLAGMPLRLLTGYRPELIAARLGLRPVPEDRIVLAGARDLDPPEVAYLAAAPIRRREVADLTAADLPAGPLYVHVDLDVIDGAALPGLRYPAPGGPGAAQLADKLRLLLSTGQVAALAIACTWYPGHAAAQHIAPHLTAILQLAAPHPRAPGPPSAVPVRPRRCGPGAVRWRRAGRWPGARSAPGRAAAPPPGRTPRPPR